MEDDDQKLETVQPDARYPNQNATKWCFATFVDYHRCCKLLGDENSCCEQFAKIYKSLCPNAWIERWEDQLQVGTFPLDLPDKEECKGFK